MPETIKIFPKNYSINLEQIELFSEEFFGKILTQAGSSGKLTSVQIEFEDTKIEDEITSGAILSILFKETLNSTYKIRKE